MFYFYKIGGLHMTLKLAPFKWLKKNNVPVQRNENNFIVNLQKEMNRIFDEFYGMDTDYPLAMGESFGEVNPKMDMTENDQNLLVTLELPGLTEADINVSLNEDLLTVSGEKKIEKEETIKGWYRMERTYGNFTRNIPLPSGIDTNRCEAVFKSGILTITMPKSADHQKNIKKIPIKGA